MSVLYIPEPVTDQELLELETHSDAGDWHERASPFDGSVHMVPGFGKYHIFSTECWCHPVQSKLMINLIEHNVSQ